MGNNKEKLRCTFISNKGKPITIGKKLSRNDRCHCGSRKKYKICCMEQDDNSWLKHVNSKKVESTSALNKEA